MLRQISLSSPRSLAAYHGTGEEYTEELQQFRAELLKFSLDWPPNYIDSCSPLPLLIPNYLIDHLETLSSLLDRAVTSIVERWWTDPTGDFPKRMPLLKHQENLLRWIDGDGRRSVPSYASKRGVWRPDILLSSQSPLSTSRPYPEHPQICEINGRFPFNGFFNTAFVHCAWQGKGIEDVGLSSPVDPEKIFSSFKALIDLRKPIHLLIGSESGLDIHLYSSYLTKCGCKVCFIKPEDLRLITIDEVSGSRLYCTIDPSTIRSDCSSRRWADSIPLEEIYQVAVELHQRELELLGEDILKALAPICFNDFRTIYLVHDKRMLGIVQQEIQSLVHEHHVLTLGEAEMLKDGIVPTIIPGSAQLHALLQDIHDGIKSKNDFILKPVGSGKGKGIIFGTDVSSDTFIEHIQSLTTSEPQKRPYVIQKLIKQAKFNVVVPKNSDAYAESNNAIVGTLLMVNGQYLGPGGWRTSADRICAVSHGGAWMCSLVPSPEIGSIEKKGIGSDDKAIKAADEKNGTNRANKTTNAESVELRTISTGCNTERLTISSPTQVQSRTEVKLVNTILQETGLLILDLKFQDPTSSYLLSLIEALEAQHSHNPPLKHSSTRGFFWDVKPTPELISTQYVARSETTQDFPWHTDCSYVSAPPRFFALQVLQADRRGGGTLCLLKLSTILKSLSSETISVLSEPVFKILVPPEFENGTEYIIGPLLVPSAGNGDLRCRFRADIIRPLTKKAEEAFDEFNAVLRIARNGKSELCVNLTPEILPNGSIVLLDNGRWLHARNEVKDAERHLRRIRWDARNF